MFEPTLIDDLLERAVANYSDKLAAADGDVRLRYTQFHERVRRVGVALQALGVVPPNRVAVLDKNSRYYLELYFALPRIGAVAVPLNYRLAAPELAYIINDSSARALIFSREFADTVAQIIKYLPSVHHYICLEGGVDFAEDFETLVEQATGALADFPRESDDVMLQMYTSGTTGRPKGAMLTHGNLIANTLTTNHERDYNPGDTYLHVAPLYHVADLELFYGMTYACGSNVIVREFSPEAVLGAIERERVTVTLLVPAMINFLLEYPHFDEYDLSSLRLVVYGGSAIPRERLRAALERFPCKFAQGYGLTETSPVLCVLPSDDHVAEGPRVRRIESCGRPAHNVEVRVVDERGEECPDEAVGEIVARGKNVMKGYWNMPEATAHAIHDGWFHTGDMAFRDKDGYIYIVDRKKDMIVTGAENVYPREVEEVLYTHPGVMEAAVVGVPSERWGETVKAVVVRRPGRDVSAEELITHCREHLAHFKCPTSVDFLDELPRNASGKVLKRVLREPYWQDEARQVH